MEITISTDKNIHGGEKFSSYVNTVINEAMSDMSNQLTHVGVHLTDQNNSKDGFNDKRCILEFRLKGRESSAVSFDANTVDEALTGAVEKALHSLEHTIGKMRER